MVRLMASLLSLLMLEACSHPDTARSRSTDSTNHSSTMAPTFSLTSSAFANGGPIPTQFTCDGANHSPPLTWSGAPATAASFALTVEDPDAPGGTFVHWVIYDLPAATSSLPQNVPKGGTLAEVGGARQGKTGFGGAPGYSGPCPPKGAAHHYHFRLVALDARLGLAAGASHDQLVEATHGHVVGNAELVGTYARKT